MQTSPTTSYNQIAGQSVERLAALSDGIFAVAMTLLVLDIHVPPSAGVRGEAELWAALVGLAPQLVMFALSFMTLGIFWVGQQTQLNHLARAHRSLVWTHILFLFAVSITPFSTRLLAEYPTYRLALAAYWANIFFLGAALYMSWMCALSLGLVRADLPIAASRAIQRRIIIAQTLYVCSALLSIVSTKWSIAAIVIVQLYYAAAPRLNWRRAE
jgi:uncharacterized membrane protein